MSSDDEKKIDAIFVLEIIGRPPEHLTETLENMANQIGEEKGVKIIGTRINEPIAMKEQKDFYSSFMEVEAEFDEILYLAVLMFKYMPAHIEIISPQNLTLSNAGFNDLFNELTRRLHGYEEIARILQTEKMILENQLKTIIGGEKKSEKKEMEKKKVKNPKGRKRKNEN
jgi:hypothetical protein